MSRTGIDPALLDLTAWCGSHGVLWEPIVGALVPVGGESGKVALRKNLQTEKHREKKPRERKGVQGGRLHLENNLC